MEPLRVVPDINTGVSGYLWPGPSRRVIEAAATESITLLISTELLVQAESVLRRSKFSERMRVVAKDIDAILAEIRGSFELVDSQPVTLPALRDQRDLPVLTAAVGGHADLIVTGDKDLLVLKSFQGIGIVTPVELLHTLGLD